jgi:phosphate-selective porin OprO and OprP
MMKTFKLRAITTALAGAYLLGFGAHAFADSTDDLINALIAKGVLSEEEGALMVKGRELEKDAKLKKPELKFKDGMTIETPDGKHSISLTGRLHADYRNFTNYDSSNTGANTGAASDTFDIRRARLGFKGKVYENYEFEVSADLASPTNSTQPGGTTSVLDVAFLNINYFKQAQLRLGQFKMPMNLEKVTSSNYTDFMERSYVNQFAPNEDRGVMLWGVPKDGFTYALALSNGEGKNRNEKDSRVDGLEYLARGTVNFAQLMDNKEAVFHLGAAFSTTDLSKTSTANAAIGGDTNFLAGANTVRTEGRGVNIFAFPTLASINNVDNSIERQRTALEGVAAYGPVKLQTEYMKTNFNGNLTAAKSFDVDVNTWYAEALWMITGEKYADMYKDGAFGAIKPKNNFEVGKEGLGAWEIGLRYSKFDASDFNSPLFVGASATAGNTPTVVITGVTTAISASASTFKADAWTAGIKFVPNPNTRFLINYIRTSFDTPITIAGKPEDKESAITMRAQFNF